MLGLPALFLWVHANLVGELGTGSASPHLPEAPFDLVLWITVDQLRADMLPRFSERFGEQGFRRLLRQGIHFRNAHYSHTTTYTAVGHATLFTGAHPTGHGLAGNDWYDRQRSRPVYCVEDARHRLLGPTETAPGTGTSPRNLRSSTIGDEWVMASGQTGRVFSLSIKDRGAILPAGRLGKAFWYDRRTGGFQTSSYYFDSQPEWLREWNATRPAERYRGQSWSLLHDRERYLFADQDDRSCEHGPVPLGNRFPKSLAVEGPLLFEILRSTPMGDALTVEFAEALMREYRLGHGKSTDLLAISLSCTDYIGHVWGPNSLEAEDNLMRLDRSLSRLLDFVDAFVGLERTLVVLSSDHGVDASPEHRHALSCRRDRAREWVLRPGEPELLWEPQSGSLCCEAGRHFPERLKQQVERTLHQRFELPKAARVVVAYKNASLYFDERVLEFYGVRTRDAERVAAEALAELPGIARTYSRTDILNGQLGQQGLDLMVQHSFDAERSGNVFFLQSPFWYLYPDPTGYAAMHGSPYRYDTHVPVVFSHPNFEAREIFRRIGPEDIAPTVASILGCNFPSACVGSPLSEVLNPRPAD